MVRRLLPILLAAAAVLVLVASSAAAFCHHHQQLPAAAMRRRASDGRCRALAMRHQPSGEERERAVDEKQLREKQSQVLLAQRIQHIKRLRKARREEIVETEWYRPRQPNLDWRNAFAATASGEDSAAAAGVVDEISEMIEFKAERCVGWLACAWVCLWGGLWRWPFLFRIHLSHTHSFQPHPQPPPSPPQRERRRGGQHLCKGSGASSSSRRARREPRRCPCRWRRGPVTAE